MLKSVGVKLCSFRENCGQKWQINLTVLIILCLVVQHSFFLKFFGIFLVIIFNFDTLRRINFREIPFFYAFIIFSEFLKFVFFNESYGLPHLAQFLVGIIYWISSLVLCWLLYYSAKEGKFLNRSLDVFSIANLCFSIWQYISICISEGVVNPYNTGHNHPFGISSGDLINGLPHGVHLTNAFISLFLCVYYVWCSRPLLAGGALVCLLLTGSNYATIIFFISVAVLFFLITDFKRRIYIASAVVITVLFYALVTPLNAEYLLQKTLHITATLPNSKRDIEMEVRDRERGYREETIADTNMPYEVKGIVTRRVPVKTSEESFNFIRQPGKSRSFFQTKRFLESSTRHFLFGTGMGGFSSKLAFNSSGVMEGSALAKILPQYETSYFRDNHKAIYGYLKTQHIMFHSESNRPFSVYNQLLGEYGVIGFIAFVVFYIWYFFKRINKRTYAMPLLIALLFILNIDYFIESLSVLLFFELLMFMDIRNKHVIS